MDLVRGNLSLTWIFFILGSFIPIAIFFISWKFDLKNFPITLAVYMFFASIIVWKTAMKNPNHYAHQLATLLSAIVLLLGGLFIVFWLVMLIFVGADFLSGGSLIEWIDKIYCRNAVERMLPMSSGCYD